jgi:hypothetical protein
MSNKFLDLYKNFIRTLDFELFESKSKTERTKDVRSKLNQINLRLRQRWDINPRTRISLGKNAGYNRAKEKRNIENE